MTTNAILDEYRACWYQTPEGQYDTVLTSTEQATLPDAELKQAALRYANAAGLVGPEWPQVPEEDFIDGLHIGIWKS